MAATSVTITWLGHGTFFYQSSADIRILVDPWLSSNPKCPDGWRERLEQGLDASLITHGYFDHVSDLATIALATGA